jgi:hypothetical protein
VRPRRYRGVLPRPLNEYVRGPRERIGRIGTPRKPPASGACRTLLTGGGIRSAYSSIYSYERLESSYGGHIVGRRFGRVVLFLAVRPMAARQVGVMGDSNPWCSRLLARTGVSLDPSSAVAGDSVLDAICADRGISCPIGASFASALVSAQCSRLTIGWRRPSCRCLRGETPRPRRFCGVQSW